jgi:hypothetical protein
MAERKNEVPALTGDSSLTFVFPISVAIQLCVRNREFLKYRVDGDRLIVEKMRGDGSRNDAAR